MVSSQGEWNAVQAKARSGSRDPPPRPLHRYGISFMLSGTFLPRASRLYRGYFRTTGSMTSHSDLTRYKLVFFTPPAALPNIKEAIFATGAGRYPGAGDYSKVCFTSPGISQFLPGESAKPAIGKPGKLEEVDEVRCEILCVGQDVAKEAVEALKK
jgi:hypothetical protein